MKNFFGMYLKYTVRNWIRPDLIKVILNYFINIKDIGILKLNRVSDYQEVYRI